MNQLNDGWILVQHGEMAAAAHFCPVVVMWLNAAKCLRSGRGSNEHRRA